MPMKPASPRHNQERDHIAEHWPPMPFTCAGCREQAIFSTVHSLETEQRYKGLLCADVVARDRQGNIVGSVEVIHSHWPSEKALKAQEHLMQFAYYRIVPKPGRRGAWLCSPQCLEWYDVEHPPRWENSCSSCSRSFTANPHTNYQFRQSHGDLHSAYCSRCVLAHGTHLPWQMPDDLPHPQQGEPTQVHHTVAQYCQSVAKTRLWRQIAQREDGNKPQDDGAAHTPLSLGAVNRWLEQQRPSRAAHLLNHIILTTSHCEEDLRQRDAQHAHAIADAWANIAHQTLERLPTDLARHAQT